MMNNSPPIANIILSKILAMPLPNYIELIEKTTGKATRKETNRQARKLLARVKINDQGNPYGLVSNPLLETFFLEKPGMIEKKLVTLKWINTRNKFCLHILNTLIRLQEKYWLSGDKGSLRPLTQRAFLQQYPCPYLDASRLSRLLPGLDAQTPHGEIVNLHFLFVSKHHYLGYQIRKILKKEKEALNDEKLQNILTGRGITVSARTVGYARKKMRIPNSRQIQRGYDNHEVQFGPLRLFNRKCLKKIPKKSGVYEINAQFFQPYPRIPGQTVYLGSSKCLQTRLRNHTLPHIKNPTLLNLRKHQRLFIRFIVTKNYRLLERNLLHKFKDFYGELPLANRIGGGYAS